MTQKAVFFDRDDTLIIDKGYMHKPEDLKFFADTFSTLKELQKRGYKLFIVTNQSGIGRGFFSEDQMHTFNTKMLAELQNHNIKIEDISFCPHSPDDKCSCRKPSPKMIKDLANLHDIDLSKSYMIGDKTSDFEAGINAGTKSIIISQQSDSKPQVKHLAEILEIIS